jgi:hypothetical protein
MDSLVLGIIIMLLMATTLVLFFFLFFTVIAYLILAFQLISQMKKDDYELWESLGKPTFIPSLSFKGVTAQFRFV